MKPTKQDITSAIKELQDAMNESFDADRAEEDAKLRKIKAHKRLTMARDEIRNLRFS